MTKKRSRAVFGVNSANELFVQLRCAGISALIAFMDCLTLHQFDKKKTLYISVKDAIDWHEKELQYQPKRPGSKEIVKKLREVLAQHEKSTVTHLPEARAT